MIQGYFAQSTGRRSGGGDNSPQQAFDLLVRTAGALDQQVARLLKPAAVTPAQYNVLRILRDGHEGEGLSCGVISERLVRHDPDVTRLLDRLEAMGFVSRSRDPNDRRVVLARVTPEGEKLLDELDPQIGALHAQQFEKLSSADRKLFMQLLHRLRNVNH